MIATAVPRTPQAAPTLPVPLPGAPDVFATLLAAAPDAPAQAETAADIPGSIEQAAASTAAPPLTPVAVPLPPPLRLARTDMAPPPTAGRFTPPSLPGATPGKPLDGSADAAPDDEGDAAGIGDAAPDPGLHAQDSSRPATLAPHPVPPDAPLTAAPFQPAPIDTRTPGVAGSAPADGPPPAAPVETRPLHAVRSPSIRADAGEAPLPRPAPDAPAKVTTPVSAFPARSAGAMLPHPAPSATADAAPPATAVEGETAPAGTRLVRPAAPSATNAAPMKAAIRAAPVDAPTPATPLAHGTDAPAGSPRPAAPPAASLQRPAGDPPAAVPHGIVRVEGAASAPLAALPPAVRATPDDSDPATALIALVGSTPATLPVMRRGLTATDGRPPAGATPPLPANVPPLLGTTPGATPIATAVPAAVDEIAPTEQVEAAPIAAAAPPTLPATATTIAPALPAVADLAAAARLDLAAGNQWLDQLAQDITRAADTNRDLRFQLAPPNLGRLHVAIAMQADGAAIRLTTETPEAQRILHDAQPVLVAEARAQGLRVAETQVDLGQPKFEGAGGGTGYSHNPQQQADGRQPRSALPQPPRMPAAAEERSAADVTPDDHLYA